MSFTGRQTGLSRMLFVDGQDMADYITLPCSLGFKTADDKNYRTSENKPRLSKSMNAASICKSCCCWC